MEFDRIVSDPDTLGGKPRVRGTRLSVEHLLELIADGSSIDDILAGWPVLEREDCVQAIRFASQVAGGAIVAQTASTA
jgi:uncharacterized protein (DUF433 family)